MILNDCGISGEMYELLCMFGAPLPVAGIEVLTTVVMKSSIF
jgi:hypothetical protein